MTICFTFTCELHAFLGFYVINWCLFISSWRAPLSILCEAGLVVKNSLNFGFSGNAIIFHLWRTTFLNIVGCQLCSFSALKISSHSFQDCKVSVENLLIALCCSLLCDKCHFSHKLKNSLLERGQSYSICANVNWYCYYGEKYEGSLKYLNTELSYDPEFSLLGIYPEKTRIE